ncbi:phage major capsid protein [Paenibacillus macquariensis]|uniref:Phage major capsid protein, HK97 family n=1 Tax=Paenibacillus macquariensis TaxID=948756 RepID=A0ABY1JSE2_9BACL|nr:phage major capsid protein [Paenibacillus macquariensis]MEC0092879.1 phage major capsid protein [Paenibacillus macquariensis]OAB36252.1 capsid protein [Paenibacillus macquariensis subsp. macquariensis]SIQ68023.1 phage major capsid protein, HK97 family [Paenibacillus macquariensis]
MDEKERELRQKLAAKLEEARSLAGDGKLEEARSAKDAAQALRSQIDLMVEMRELDTPGETTPAEPEKREVNSDKDNQYRSAFLKELRNKPLNAVERTLIEEAEAEVRAGMQGGVGEDGGLTVPQDIQTMIHEKKRQFVSLENYVTVEPVSTRSGTRVIEKNADIIAFTEITELTDLDDMDNPKFASISYAVKDRGGILPMSNSLLQDTDQNLMEYISKWIAKKSVITRNKLILTLLATLPKKAIADLDAIKKVLNVDLDPSISLSAIILTNQDGYNFLDQQKDLDGRALMQPDPTQPTQKLLFGKPVVVISNRWLPTTGSATKKAPIIVGDLKEAIVLFDRQQYSIASTNVGGKSFGRNSTDVRAIQREDVQKFDDEAVVYGELTIV